MMISPRHGFVFLCTPKCASTAIEQALRPHCGLAIGGAPQIKHAGFAEYQRHIEPFLREVGGVDCAALTVIALMREPLDWLESWWRYRQRPALADPAHRNHRNYTGDMSFEAFLDAYFAGKTGLRRQHEHLCDLSGGYDGIEIHRYERLGPFAARMEALLGRALALEAVNVSPPASPPASPAASPHAADERWKARLAAEYELYDRLA